uniref:Ribonuclease H n=1 Tax=Culicoides sonorensis TaxID=179676 RepID=A0A336LL17_CULSO
FNTESEAKSFINGDLTIATKVTSKRPLESTSSTSKISAKRFKSTSTATSDLGKVTELKEIGKYTFPVDENGFVHVYTDGSCEGNGSKIACAGMFCKLFRMPFYAVANGKIPGIYKTWAECENQVKGFSGAKYKK